MKDYAVHLEPQPSEGMLTHLFFPVRNWSGVWLISSVRRLTLPMVECCKKGIFQERIIPRKDYSKKLG